MAERARPAHAAVTAAVLLATFGVGAAQARTSRDEAIRFVEGAVPAHGAEAYQVGRGLLAAGDVTGAMAQFRAALLDTPQSVDALNGLAVCYDRMGRFDLSRGYYDAALAIDPQSALVLNNLGYSLYLQNDFRGAIPILQRAAESSDSVAAATSQRLLTLAGVRLREASLAPDPRVARAETTAPRARIETTASGEQRLVIGAPPADTAGLGDDAPLIEIARAWTDDDEARVAAAAAAADREAAAAAAPYATAAAAPPPPHPAGIAPATASFAPPASEAPVAPAPAATARLSPPAGRRRDEAAAIATMVPLRRAEGRQPAVALAGLEPNHDSAVARFESDDEELNAFAARMRGGAANAAAQLRVGEAVARNEGLIARTGAA